RREPYQRGPLRLFRVVLGRLGTPGREPLSGDPGRRSTRARRRDARSDRLQDARRARLFGSVFLRGATMRLRQKIQIKVVQALARGLSVLERGIRGVSLNLLDPALARDPYPHFNRLRDKAPIHYSFATRLWWVTPFDYVQEILRDKRFGADVRKF